MTDLRMIDEDELVEKIRTGFMGNYNKHGELKSFWQLVLRDIVLYGAATIVLILLLILVSWLL